MSMLANPTQLNAAASFAPETPEEVALALRQAARSGLQVVVVASCHGLPPIGDLSGSMLLDVSGFDSVEVDPDTGIARVGGGADWKQVIAAAAPHGLTGPFGSSATVGVTGFISGGGIGPFSRCLGLATNAVRAFEIVTPCGVARRIDAVSDPDLFWALRGGGGGFGVVTGLELQLTRMPEMSGGLMIWPLDRAAEVVPAWAEWTRSVPADLTSSIRLINLPGIEPVVMVLATAPRPADSLLGDVSPLQAMEPIVDTIGDTDPLSFIEAYSDPDKEGEPPATEHVLLDRLPAEAADQAVELSRPGSGIMMLEFRHLGGALGRSPQGSGAQGSIDGEYSLFTLGLPGDTAGMAHLVDVLSGYGRGRSYFNFVTRREGRETVFPAATNRRLAELYRAVDPDQLMNHPQPMYDRERPSSAGLEPSDLNPPAGNHSVASPDHRPPRGGNLHRPAVGSGS